MYLNATLLAQMTVFLILAWFTMRFVWPPIMRVLDERAKKIAEGLEAAEESKKSLDLASKRSIQTINEGRQKASEIVKDAEGQAQKIIEKAQQQAQMEADLIKKNAKAEIEREVSLAKETLRNQVSSLAVAGAEKILRREIDSASHAKILSTLKQEL